MAVMLFGDRIAAGVLVQRGLSRSLTDNPAATLELLALADAIGLRLVAARA